MIDTGAIPAILAGLTTIPMYGILLAFFWVLNKIPEKLKINKRNKS